MTKQRELAQAEWLVYTPSYYGDELEQFVKLRGFVGHVSNPRAHVRGEKTGWFTADLNTLRPATAQDLLTR